MGTFHRILGIVKQIWAIRPPIITALVVFLALPIAITSEGKVGASCFVFRLLVSNNMLITWKMNPFVTRLDSI